MTDRQAGRSAGKTPVRDERAGFSQTLRLEVTGGVEHFLHAGPALWPFIADDDDIACLDFIAQDAGDRRVLAFIDARRSVEDQDALVHARGLHDAAFGRKVAEQHGQAAILGKGMFGRADHALLAVAVQFLPARRLAEGDLRRHAAGRGAIEIAHFFAVGAANVPAGERIAHRAAVHRRQAGVDQPRALQLAQDRHDPAGAVDILHMDVVLGGRDLAEARHAARQPVDVRHGEIDAAFMSGSEQVQHRVGRSAHGDVQTHRIFEGGVAGDGPRQHAVVILLIIALGDVDDQMPGLAEQPLAVGVGGERRTIAGQRQAQRFGQAIHRIGREHARTAAAGRAGGALDRLHFLVGIALLRCRGQGGLDGIEDHFTRHALLVGDCVDYQQQFLAHWLTPRAASLPPARWKKNSCSASDASVPDRSACSGPAPAPPSRA